MTQEQTAPAASPARRERIGVLLAALGTPDGHDYWSIRRYLSEFLSDKRVIDYPAWQWQPILQGIVLTRRPFATGANYRKIWDKDYAGSPLLTLTRAQTAAIGARLTADYGDEVMVDFGMRYGNPSIASRLHRMIAAGCTRVLFFPLYPQYAGATTATACDQLFRALMKEKRQPAVRTVPAYYAHPLYVDALARSVERAYAGLSARPDVLVATYHGLPRRYVDEGDPYFDHCHRTTHLLRERLGWPEGSIVTTFQSVFGREEWLRPYTVEHVAELARAGKKSIAIVAPAFSADCLETLEEIQGEIRDAFIAAGGRDFAYVPCLNDEPAHVEALAAIIRDNLAGWSTPRMSAADEGTHMARMAPAS